jgi:hypothetical protein
MLDNPRRAKGGGWAVLALGLLVALPVLYVLSAGPAFRLVGRGRVDYDTFLVVYGPIGRVAARSEAGVALWDWYKNLWYPADTLSHGCE